MELDDLKSAWNDLGARSERQETALQLVLREARRARLDRAHDRLRSVRRVLWVELLLGIVAALLTGSYLADHLATPRLVLPAALLHLAAIVTIAVPARQLHALAAVDYGAALAVAQGQLAALRLARARFHAAVLATSPLLWALLVVVVPHGLVGLDVWRAFGPAWVLANLGFGVAVLAAAWAVARRRPSWLAGVPLLAALGDDLAGRRLAAAAAELEEVVALTAPT